MRLHFSTLSFHLKRLGTTYIVHLRLIGKLVEDFLFVLIEFFTIGVTAEPLRTNIDWRSAFL